MLHLSRAFIGTLKLNIILTEFAFDECEGTAQHSTVEQSGAGSWRLFRRPSKPRKLLVFKGHGTAIDRLLSVGWMWGESLDELDRGVLSGRWPARNDCEWMGEEMNHLGMNSVILRHE